MRVGSFFLAVTAIVGSVNGGQPANPTPTKVPASRWGHIGDSRVFQANPNKHDAGDFSKSHSNKKASTPKDNPSSKDDPNLPHTHPFGYHPHF